MKTQLTLAALCTLASLNLLAEQSVERITVKGVYLSVNEANSIKSPTPIIDVPQSLSIMTSEEIAERGLNSIRGIVDYTPGVNTSQGEGHRDAVVFRGVRSTADFYIDGFRDDVQYYRSLYNLEQVEILRGPNALLFGRGGTGGILNRVTKKARLTDEFTNYQATIHTFGEFGLQLDTNLVATDTSAIRINAMYESLDNHRDFYDGERVGFNPTARFSLGENTQLDLSYEYIDHDRFIDRGVPTLDGVPVDAFEDTVFADPNNNYHTLSADVLRATLEHQFNDSTKGNFSVFYGDYDKVYANFYATNYDATLNQVELDGYIDATVRENLIISGNLVSEFDALGVEHTLIVGTEFINTDSSQNRFNPVFSTNQSDRAWFDASRPIQLNNLAGVNAQGEAFTVPFDNLNDDTDVDLQTYSLYIQDEISLSEKLDIVLGARFDSFDISVFNAVPDSLEIRERTDEQVSPRAGIIFKPQENISLYASYSESFLPRSGEQYTDINGAKDQLAPDTFATQEVGIKWDFARGLSLTAAVFENEQESPQVADNDSSTLDVINSEITGFEVQLSGSLTDQLNLTANYSQLDGEIVDRTGPTGLTPRELPEKTFSLWSHYQATERFGVAAGVTHQDESFINNSNSARLPSYTRVDAAVYYDLKPTLRVQLNLENITDELYYPHAHSTHQASVGEPFNATLGLFGSF